MENLLTLMKSRRGVRQFSSRPVPEDILAAILEAGVAAPSGPIGGTKIIVVDALDKRRQLRKMCLQCERKWLAMQPEKVRERLKALSDFDMSLTYLETAPILLVVTTRPKDPEVPYAVESAFLAVGYMLVMIEGLGLGSVTYSPPVNDEEDVQGFQSILALPHGEDIQAVLPVGYPMEKPKPRTFDGYFNVYHNQFGLPLKLKI